MIGNARIILSKIKPMPMPQSYTLLFLSQHLYGSQQLTILPHDDISADTDVADFLQSAEQQAGRQTLDKIYAFASESLKLKNADDPTI